MLPGSIWLAGCGNMGGVMLRRWIASGIEPASVTVIDPKQPDVPSGVRLVADFRSAGTVPEAIVLAVKPQQLRAVAADMLGPLAGQSALLVSILAGVEEATLQDIFGADAVVRAMPNLPVAIGKGVVALHSGSTDPRWRSVAEALMAPLGLVEWIDREDQFDAVTALSGCGPAFLFRFIDALAGAGAALGLPADQAARLALATVEGSALLAAAGEDSPAVMADRVASPGGSTREGLNVLDEADGIAVLLRRTMAAAARRNAEMAAAARG